MAKHDSEPSVEEILASIKKVIAQDSRQAAAFAKNDDDVLELTGGLDPVTDEDDALISDAKRTAMAESLVALSTLSEPSAAPKIVQSGETSLEGLTRDLLKPMLAQWLDANLPPLVETLVAREISRITKKT